MKKKKLLKQFDYVVKHCFVGQSFMDVTVSAFVYSTSHRFLWFKWNTIDTKFFVPFIPSPFYDGEHATNCRLSIAKDMLEAKCESFISTLDD